MSCLERWYHRLHEIPRAGLSRQRSANADLRALVAAELDIPACKDLTIDYRLVPVGKDTIELTGTLKARLVRTCIVTLEEIEETIKATLDCRLVPPTALPGASTEEQEALAVEEIEPFENDTIPVGRIAYEVLAANLDPYPRKPGEHLEVEPDLPKDEEQAEHPFAVLARLRGNTGEDTG